MNKKIYFCTDLKSFAVMQTATDTLGAYTYEDTASMLSQHRDNIVTTSLAHLTSALADLGYDIYLCKGGSKVKIEQPRPPHPRLEKHKPVDEEQQDRLVKGVLTSCAMSFINYLDAHKYEGKMCVSNGECEDIENAFRNAGREKLHRYFCKYIEQKSVEQGKTALEAANKVKEDNANKIEPFTIEAGKWYVCIRDYKLPEIIPFKKGVVYEAILNGVLLDKDGEKWTFGDGKDWFRPATKEEVLKAKYGITSIGSKNAEGKLAEKLELKEIEEPENFKNQVMSEITDLVEDYITQEPAEWSEEDEEMLQKLIEYFDYKRHFSEQEDFAILLWLKSLKDKTLPQKQEWSEEDERIRTCLIKDQEEALEHVKNDKYGHSEIISDLKEMYRERIDWLKSLRPQKQWKPADSHLQALRRAIHKADKDSDAERDLKDLYEHLNRKK